MTTTATVGYMAVAAGELHREVSLFQRQFGPPPREAGGYQRRPGPTRGDAAGPQRQPGPVVRGPVNGGFQNARFPDGDSLWVAGELLTLADDQAAQIARVAQDDAAAIREAARLAAAAITQQATNRAQEITQQATDQAAAIREAAEREAAELRARLDSMLGELGRMAAYVSTSLAAPSVPSTAPSAPATAPARPSPVPVVPDTIPARPPPTKPARPATWPAGPGTAPTTKPQKRSRQQRAMRIATGTTAALVSFALIFGATEIGLHGFNFFVFRETGQGQTTDGPTDQQFLARQTAAHHQAPKGRHHKTSQPTVKTTANG